jgi:hypothetical protein
MPGLRNCRISALTTLGQGNKSPGRQPVRSSPRVDIAESYSSSSAKRPGPSPPPPSNSGASGSGWRQSGRFARGDGINEIVSSVVDPDVHSGGIITCRPGCRCSRPRQERGSARQVAAGGQGGGMVRAEHRSWSGSFPVPRKIKSADYHAHLSCHRRSCRLSNRQGSLFVD